MITAKIDSFDRDIDLIISDMLSPAAQSAALADFARSARDDAESVDTAALGQPVDYNTIVDGRRGASEDSVSPTGTIVYEFDLVRQALEWIEEMIIEHSPVLTGAYKKSHRVYVDGGAETDIKSIPASAKTVTFASISPYARLIEPHGDKPGESKQAPDGVYQSIAALGRQRFGNLMKISFGFENIAGLPESKPEKDARPHAPRDRRQPAIFVEL